MSTSDRRNRRSVTPPSADEQPSVGFVRNDDEFPKLEDVRSLRSNKASSRRGVGISPPQQVPANPLTPDEKKQRQFMDLLMSYNKKGRKSLYQIRALAIVPCEDYNFPVQFDHVLEKGYFELAAWIVERIRSQLGVDLLRLTLAEFLEEELPGQIPRVREDIFLFFVGTPTFMKPLSQFSSKDVVELDNTVMGNTDQLVKILYLGRLIYYAGIDHLNEEWDAGKSWGGDFEAKDIHFLEYSGGRILCRIGVAPTAIGKACTSTLKALDMKKMVTELIPKYKIGDQLPANFQELTQDFDDLNANSMTTTPVLQYLPYHVAMMPLAATEFLTTKLHTVLQSVRMSKAEFKVYRVVFLAPTDGEPDWRPSFFDSPHQALRGVYRHDRRGTVPGVQKPGQATEDPAGIEKFRNTREGKLGYKRHLNVHVQQHVLGSAPGQQRTLTDVFEAELFSSNNNNILAEISTVLFSADNEQMKMAPNLRIIYEAYREMRYHDDRASATVTLLGGVGASATATLLGGVGA